jgi:hypothetical protein
VLFGQALHGRCGLVAQHLFGSGHLTLRHLAFGWGLRGLARLHCVGEFDDLPGDSVMGVTRAEVFR